MAKQGNLNDQDVYKQGIYAREELSTTGIGEGIAIPHAQSEAVNAPGLAAMVVKDGVDYQSLDNQPAKLFFMIAVPKTGGNEHLQILAMLSQMLMDTDFKDSLINAQSVEEFMDLINQKEAAQKAKAEEKEEAKKDMGRMLDYIDKLNELDTTGVEPMSHVFPVNNVFRKDVVTNGDDRDEILANAPAKKDGAFMVPKTVE